MAKFNVLGSSKQFIIGEIHAPNKGSQKIAIIYGNKDVYKRRILQKKLQLYSTEDKPLVIGGDFNCPLNMEDKRRGKRFIYSLGAKEMDYFLTNNDLREVC